MKYSKEQLGKLYERRLLVFIETEPQSNKYNQVILNPEQFKKVSSNTGVKVKSENLREGFEMFKHILSEEEYTLPDLQSFYID